MKGEGKNEWGGREGRKGGKKEWGREGMKFEGRNEGRWKERRVREGMKQGCGSGSAWIRKYFTSYIRINMRIRI